MRFVNICLLVVVACSWGQRVSAGPITAAAVDSSRAALKELAEHRGLVEFLNPAFLGWNTSFGEKELSRMAASRHEHVIEMLNTAVDYMEGFVETPSVLGAHFAIVQLRTFLSNYSEYTNFLQQYGDRPTFRRIENAFERMKPIQMRLLYQSQGISEYIAAASSHLMRLDYVP